MEIRQAMPGRQLSLTNNESPWKLDNWNRESGGFGRSKTKDPNSNFELYWRVEEKIEYLLQNPYQKKGETSELRTSPVVYTGAVVLRA